MNLSKNTLFLLLSIAASNQLEAKTSANTKTPHSLTSIVKKIGPLKIAIASACLLGPAALFLRGRRQKNTQPPVTEFRANNLHPLVQLPTAFALSLPHETPQATIATKELLKEDTPPRIEQEPLFTPQKRKGRKRRAPGLVVKRVQHTTPPPSPVRTPVFAISPISTPSKNSVQSSAKSVESAQTVPPVHASTPPRTTNTFFFISPSSTPGSAASECTANSPAGSLAQPTELEEKLSDTEPESAALETPQSNSLDNAFVECTPQSKASTRSYNSTPHTQTILGPRTPSTRSSQISHDKTPVGLNSAFVQTPSSAGSNPSTLETPQNLLSTLSPQDASPFDGTPQGKISRFSGQPPRHELGKLRERPRGAMEGNGAMVCIVTKRDQGPVRKQSPGQ